jgi:signal transduction histidine kinase/ActR/RegA family two-component response regulator
VNKGGRGALNLAAREVVPQAGWEGSGEDEHFVQFYESDEFLLGSLSGYVGAGLEDGDACVVVATEARRAGLDAHLRRRGHDPRVARGRGQFFSLDASEILSRFMVGGSPEPSRFEEVVGGLIERAGGGSRRVRIFGEMVALLWAAGNSDAAIRLESLWNGLQQQHPFRLFCAYPMSHFGGDAQAGPLGHVCAEHARVIPAESYTALSCQDDRLRAIVELQRKALALEAEIAERKEAESVLRALKEKLEQEAGERQRLLTREQTARVQAEQSNRLKDEFLATVSHELRTPLTAIIGWAHMLRHSSLDEATAQRGLETIERNAQAQAQLVEDILDVSRVIAGKLRLSIVPVDLAAVVNAAIDSVQLAAEAKGIQLEVTLDPSARHVSGDAGRLQQVVWNLLSNAIKFTEEGGVVCVRLRRAGTDVELRVSDDGCGISRDFLPHIFERFRQADGTITRRHGGLGLGLAIARHLVELHGGTVTAESAGEGKGAAFTIRLPLADAGRRARGRRGVGRTSRDGVATRQPLPALKGVRVLLVDDDRDTLHLLGVLLNECGAAVQAAASAAEALEALEWFTPDVLVSDLSMPEEDGFSLISKVRTSEAAHVPAVALTASVRAEDRARALASGFQLFVPKPVEPRELATAVADLVEHGTGYADERARS